MKKYTFLFTLAFVSFLTACTDNIPTQEDLIPANYDLSELTADGKLYTLNGFIDSFMTEQGNYLSETTPYCYRATNGDGIYLFSIDTLPSGGEGIYIQGRVITDDYGGNFYKSLVIQQIVDGKQQALRLSVDAGSVSGMYPLGQQILIRCNGLSIGRYANQPQLCVPSYNNKTTAQNAEEKMGWDPGRIPTARFKAATTRLGLPDKNAVVADTLTAADLSSLLMQYDDVVGARKQDGRLIVLRNVFFTGQYENQGTLTDCNTDDPTKVKDGPNVFASTTGNVGYPQSRVISDGSNSTLISTSEYAKFAYFYLPGADKNGITDCKNWKGTITGILSYYMDNPAYAADKWQWAVYCRDLNDIMVYKDGEKWDFKGHEYGE